jgi:uncharacterized SAM-binding protein YcdF (DUF218 family)
MIFAALPTYPMVRNWFAAPLVLNDTNARGGACYVLAGGGAIRERLDAASDLIHMGQVPTILLMRNDKPGAYSFKARKSWTGTEWSMDYLAWHGVMSQKITLLEEVHGLFGTLAEARNVAKQLSKNVKTLVVVSSAPHMRRTVLAFRRSLPADVKVIPYAATTFENSYEMYHPIWLEYLKLLVYYVVA